MPSPATQTLEHLWRVMPVPEHTVGSADRCGDCQAACPSHFPSTSVDPTGTPNNAPHCHPQVRCASPGTHLWQGAWSFHTTSTTWSPGKCVQQVGTLCGWPGCDSDLLGACVPAAGHCVAARKNLTGRQIIKAQETAMKPVLCEDHSSGKAPERGAGAPPGGFLTYTLTSCARTSMGPRDTYYP